MPDIPRDKLRKSPQVRRVPDPEAVKKLADSIASFGLLQPIGVFETGDGFYEILYGHQRDEAFGLLGRTHIPATIHPKPASAAVAAALQVTENKLRTGLPPIDEALALVSIMRDEGLNASQLAKRLAVNPGEITKALSRLSLPENVQRAVNEGSIGPDPAYLLSRVPDASEQERLATQLVKGELTRDQLAAIVKKRKEPAPKQQPSQKVARLVLNLGQGRTMTIAGPALSSVDTLISWLEELLTSCRKANKSGFAVNTLQKVLKDQAKNCA